MNQKIKTIIPIIIIFTGLSLWKSGSRLRYITSTSIVAFDDNNNSNNHEINNNNDNNNNNSSKNNNYVNDKTANNLAEPHNTTTTTTTTTSPIPTTFTTKPRFEPPEKPDKPILILFTTFKDDPKSVHHRLAHKIVAKNWASFGLEYIKPVLFTNSSLAPKIYDPATAPKHDELPFDASLAEIALSHGWDILKIPEVNNHGTPYLKPMFKEIFQKYNATYYGFANGDLLFDDGFLRSLYFVKSYLQHPLNNNVLLVGRRTDVPLYSNNTVLPYQQPTTTTITTPTTTTTADSPGKFPLPLQNTTASNSSSSSSSSSSRVVTYQ
ncbi:hypothetical protein HELRODRAFT_192963 [Helobdella robusta]|uniref:Uncharacterized protein n=1 Tax=Helobdella robusta TaxID=6412 RepID=T1FUG6_HELRO|nr:hypothetical protein HELRODRAFT_192963 [Helobdella robusta]ESN98507.1 hypothetical protein HELRODRAFT_192963 [Helobdella robusta]